MANDYDELTVHYEEDGQVLVEELDKQILNKGLWTTVLFLYRERNKKTGEFGLPKAGLRRYQKVGGYFKKRDAINLSEKTTPELMAKLKEWFQL